MTDCPNNICIGMSKSLCYPHGIELGSFTREQFEVNRSERLKAGKRGLTDDNIHGPNERLHLPTWERGIQAMTRFFVEAAADGQ